MNILKSEKKDTIEKYGIFISHSWNEKGLATTIAQELDYLHCGKVWIDYENIEGGDKLDNSIRNGLENTRYVIVLWSKSASKSSWVSQEIRLAVSMRCKIMPCVLDNTKLETNRNLAGRLYCDFRISFDCGLSELVGYLYDDATITSEFTKNLQEKINLYEKLFKRDSKENLDKSINQVLITQEKIIDAINTVNINEAIIMQADLNITIEKLTELCPRHPDILTLDGDHLKNEFQIKRFLLWQHSPDKYSEQNALDQYGNLLDISEKYFYRSLSVKPLNPGAMNGIGTIYILRGNIQIGEHWKLRAKQTVRKLGGHYDAADEDVKVIRNNLRPGYIKPDDLLMQVPAFSPKGISLKLNYLGSSRYLPQKIRRVVLSALLETGEFFQSLGFIPFTNRQVTIDINPDSDESRMAYIPEYSTITIPPWCIIDPQIISLLYSRFVLITLWEEGGHEQQKAFSSLLSGLADYFTCSLYDSPKLCERLAVKMYGTDCIRSLSNENTFASAGDIPQNQGIVWGGIFWNIRDAIGNSVADKLIFSTWKAICKCKKLERLDFLFIKELLKETRKVSKEYKFDYSAWVDEIIQKR